MPHGPPLGPRWKPTLNKYTRARRYTGWPAPRDRPHGNGRALDRRADETPIPTQQPPITAPDHNLHPPVRDVVLPNAAVRTPRSGLTDGVELSAVVGISPPLGAPINRCGPAERMA